MLDLLMVSDSPKTLLTSQGELAYLESGSGQPVLCLHGLGDQALVWQSLMRSLSSTHRCIALDLPGHGDSIQFECETAYQSPNLADLLEEFAQALQLEKLTVVAHSWSAKLALRWVKQYPQRLQQLILVDPFSVSRLPAVLKLTLPLLYRTLPFLKMIGPFETFSEAETKAKMLNQYQGWSADQQALFAASMEQKSDETWGGKFSITARNGVFGDTYETSGLEEKLDVPCYILLPEQGLNRRAWQLKPYKKYLSQLTFVSIPGNHWPHLLAPEPFEAKVGKILAAGS